MAKNLQDSVQVEIEPLRRQDIQFIHKHFGDANLKGFKASNDYENQVFKVELDNERGYYFFGELAISGSHENRMERELKKQKKLSRIICKKFVDYEGHVSGFYWWRQD